MLLAMPLIMLLRFWWPGEISKLIIMLTLQIRLLMAFFLPAQAKYLDASGAFQNTYGAQVAIPKLNHVLADKTMATQ